MKLKFLSLILCLFALVSSAQTNAPAPTLNDVQKVAQTNLNQVLIEMLSGVKEASGEIYSASKEALHKSLAFVMEQAPDVFNQFLTWKFYEALSWAVFWVLMSVTLLGFSLKFDSMRRKMGGDTSGYTFGKWATRCIALVFLLMFTAPHVRTMVQIKVAPKVYAIEYVVDKAQEARNAQIQAERWGRR